jgi:Protein of unknown function (DUF3551)
MRRRFFALGALGVLVSVAANATPAKAQNYPWCAQYGGGFGGASNCGFVSYDQCMQTLSGMGGFCVANNTYAPPPGPTPHPAGMAKHPARGRKM